MIKLITNIEGDVLGNYVNEVTYVSNVSGQIGREDYIDVPGFIGLSQNLSKAEFTQLLDTPFYFGLTNQSNKAYVTLEINY